jgi:hypothetical protein
VGIALNTNSNDNDADLVLLPVAMARTIGAGEQWCSRVIPSALIPSDDMVDLLCPLLLRITDCRSLEAARGR